MLERHIKEYPKFSMNDLAVWKLRGTVEMTCSICLTKINHLAMTVKTECDHLFHAKCLLIWLNKKPTCHCCRLNVTFQGIIQHRWIQQVPKEFRNLEVIPKIIIINGNLQKNL